jgi:hypothetical protein
MLCINFIVRHILCEREGKLKTFYDIMGESVGYVCIYLEGKSLLRDSTCYEN